MPISTNGPEAARTRATPNIKRSKNPNRSLRSGRPPLLSTPSSLSSTLGTVNDRPGINAPIISSKTTKKSSKATKTLISAHHNLHKSRAKAVAANDVNLISQIDDQISQLGGLQAYQQASLTGQSADRGGDSSTVLVKWLEELVRKAQPSSSPSSSGSATISDSVSSTDGFPATTQPSSHLRVLEVGALSSRNAISRAASATSHKQDRLIESVKRIDLKSQEPGLIEEIDFMHLPVPETMELKYDVLSLSLVLNYVPEARGRGEMLKRTREFLRLGHRATGSAGSSSSLTKSASTRQTRMDAAGSGTLPCLFVVLPLPCIRNSRYLDDDRFRELMDVLGYESLRSHQSAKLHYELFVWNGIKNSTTSSKENFKKLQVNPGKGRNNFCITLEAN